AKPPVTSPARNTPSTGFLECCSPSRMMRCCSRCLFTAEDGSSTLSVWSSELGRVPVLARAGLANVLHHQARHTCHRNLRARLRTWS
ncbi:unnamed protein product, partial [Effrenium voratum]